MHFHIPIIKTNHSIKHYKLHQIYYLFIQKILITNCSQDFFINFIIFLIKIQTLGPFMIRYFINSLSFILIICFLLHGDHLSLLNMILCLYSLNYFSHILCHKKIYLLISYFMKISIPFKNYQKYYLFIIYIIIYCFYLILKSNFSI